MFYEVAILGYWCQLYSRTYLPCLKFVPRVYSCGCSICREIKPLIWDDDARARVCVCV